MLIRRQPGKSEQKNSGPAANPNKNKHDIYQQIIKLTKQNQYLRTRLDCMQHQLERALQAKEKYRLKYKNLKQNNHQNPKQDDLNKQSISIKSPTAIKAQSKGKIYFNHKFDKTKKKIQSKHNTEPNCELPSTRSDFNFKSQCFLEKNTQTRIEEPLEDPYDLASAKNTKISERISHIDQGIINIKDTLNGFIEKMEPILSISMRNPKEHQNISQLIHNRINKFEQTFQLFLSQLKTPQKIERQISGDQGRIIKLSQYEEEEQPQQNEQPSIQMNFRINQQVIKSHQFFKPEENGKMNYKNRSRSISQDYNNLEEIKRSGTKPPQRDNMSKQSHTKNSDKRRSRNDSYHKHLMVSEEYNQANRNTVNKQIGRFVESKSHRSYSNEQLPVCRQPKERNSRISSEDNSQRLQQWKMLKQIGKQLKNWKFCLTESSQIDPNSLGGSQGMQRCYKKQKNDTKRQPNAKSLKK